MSELIRKYAYYDDEQQSEDVETQVTEDDPAPEPKKGKILTQDEVNKILAEDRRKSTAKHVKQLEDLKKSINLTSQEKQNLETKIEELNQSLLTKEELSKREKERLEKDYKNKLNTTESERDTWRSRFQTSTILRSLQDAAISEEAFDHEQIIPLLQPHTRVVEEQDENGQALGFNVRVKLTEMKDGKPVTLDLSPVEAVKRLKEMTKHFNLFKSTAAGGLGLNTTSGRRTDVDFRKMSPADYREWRKKNGMKSINQQVHTT